MLSSFPHLFSRSVLRHLFSPPYQPRFAALVRFFSLPSTFLPGSGPDTTQFLVVSIGSFSYSFTVHMNTQTGDMQRNNLIFRVSPSLVFPIAFFPTASFLIFTTPEQPNFVLFPKFFLCLSLFCYVPHPLGSRGKSAFFLDSRPPRPAATWIKNSFRDDKMTSIPDSPKFLSFLPPPSPRSEAPRSYA